MPAVRPPIKTGSAHPQYKHGLIHSTEYRSWDAMIQRCTNEKSTGYRKYGARGIRVCARWRTFQGFYADMGPKPDRSYTLDRIDPAGNYEPSNCRWASLSVQANNKRTNCFISIAGRTDTLTNWVKLLNVNRYHRVIYRVRHGMDARRALQSP